MLIDQFGRNIDTTRARPDERRIEPSGSPWVRFSGYPSEGLTPGALSAIFKAADMGETSAQMELFEEMEEKDAHLAAELLKRKHAVAGLKWEVGPARCNGQTGHDPEKVADFCRESLMGIPRLAESFFDLLDAIGKGFSLAEIVWRVREKRVDAAALEWVHPRHLSFTSGRPALLTEKGGFEGQAIPEFKTILHRHKARSGHETGAGLLRVVAWMYLFKNYALKDWVAFTETAGMPLRLGRYEPGASKADKDALAQAIRSLGSDAAGVISKNTEVEFIEAARSGSLEVYEALVNLANREMSKAIVGATHATEADGRGSYALAKTHNEVRLDLVRADAAGLAATIRDQLLVPLTGFNFGWETPAPNFEFRLEEPRDLKALSEAFLNLSRMGVKFSPRHLSALFGLPLAGQEEESGPEHS